MFRERKLKVSVKFYIPRTKEDIFERTVLDFCCKKIYFVHFIFKCIYEACRSLRPNHALNAKWYIKSEKHFSSSGIPGDDLEKMKSEIESISDKLGSLMAQREAKETKDEGKLPTKLN